VKSSRKWDTPIRRRGEEPDQPPPPPPATGGKPTFEQAVEQWLDEHLSTKTGRPYSPTTKTVARYNLMGGRLTAWREARGILTAEAWTASIAAEYLEWYQHDIGADSDTIKKFRTQLRQFAGFCARTFDNREASGPALDDLRVSRAHDQKPATETAMTKAEATTLLQKASTSRDSLIVAMLLYTGMRPSELVALDESHIRLESTPPVVEIRGTAYGKHETKTQAGYRDVPLNIGQSVLLRLLHEHLGDRSRPKSNYELLLSSRLDNRNNATRLTIAGVNLMLQTLGRSTGIHCNPRRFRHTFCTWCADAGMDILTLQQLVGHKDTEMIAQYYRRRRNEEALFAAARIRF
jgi:integrase